MHAHWTILRGSRGGDVYCYTESRGVARSVKIEAAKLPDGFRGRLLQIAAKGKTSVSIMR